MKSKMYNSKSLIPFDEIVRFWVNPFVTSEVDCMYIIEVVSVKINSILPVYTRK